MNLRNWLKAATETLEQAGIGTVRLDCLVLLEDTTGKERGWLLAHPEFELTGEQTEQLNSFIKLRATHEPLAYIRHKSEFYGREFYIDHRVLEPRPESETIIEILKNLKFASHSIVVDVGTGSGMLAITAKLEFPALDVIATDIDENCLDVARQNAKTYKTDIKFMRGDLLAPLIESGAKNQKSRIPDSTLKPQPSALLCNLPYVPDDFHINPAAMAEPRIAIFGGKDGLDLYRKLFEQIQEFNLRPRFILTESMPPQHEVLAKIAKAAGFCLAKTDDFIQLFQFG